MVGWCSMGTFNDPCGTLLPVVISQWISLRSNSGSYWEEELIPQLRTCIVQTLQAVQPNIIQRRGQLQLLEHFLEGPTWSLWKPHRTPQNQIFLLTQRTYVYTTSSGWARHQISCSETWRRAAFVGRRHQQKTGVTARWFWYVWCFFLMEMAIVSWLRWFVSGLFWNNDGIAAATQQLLSSYSAATQLLRRAVEGLKASKSTASTFWSAKTWSPGALDWSRSAWPLLRKGMIGMTWRFPERWDPSDGLQQKPRNSSMYVY